MSDIEKKSFRLSNTVLLRSNAKAFYDILQKEEKCCLYIAKILLMLYVFKLVFIYFVFSL